MFRPEKASGLHSEKVGSGDHHQERSPSACTYCRTRGSVQMNLNPKKMLRANDPHILRYIHTAPRKASDRPDDRDRAWLKRPVGLSNKDFPRFNSANVMALHFQEVLHAGLCRLIFVRACY
jgi:hypothetical protein